MNALPFGDLPRPGPRRFLPAMLDLGDWAHVAPWFEALEQSLAAVTDAVALEGWLLDWGELSAALEEEQALRYVAMTCHTDDAATEKAYLAFVENVEPQVKPRQFRLQQLYLAHPRRADLPSARYAVFDRSTAVHVEVFRPENVALETEETKVGQQYNKLCGALTVTWRGEEKTLTQMGRLQEETDRAIRAEAWQLVAERRLREAEACEAIYDRLVGLRERLAHNAGFPDYRAFAFRRLGRFDYSPEDCERFQQAIEYEVMPLVRERQQARQARLGLDSLRPWDLAVDPLGRPPLRPFADVAGLLSRSQRIFDRLDPELARNFRTLQDLRLLDLENRKGKAPGGYLQPLSESRLAFIFMNSVGVQRDVETLVHEAGHAFHALATRSEDLFAYRGAPIEFCEVASMSMELLTSGFLDEFYPEADARRARQTHLDGILGFFPWMAAVDAFQHWVYTRPGHTRTERSAAWNSLLDRFGGGVDWSGFESARTHSWHRQLHIFLYPFYYVEYGIAQLGALQVWANYRRDPAAGLAAYKAGLALGGSRTLPELFAAAGCRFDFGADTLRPLIQVVRDELGRLE